MKKFVKGLLVSGFAVALLAGCSNKGKSCEPCPPVPEPETKKAWTDEELELLDYYYHDEIPFACELSLEGIEDGVLYAVSKDEVSDEDLLAYDDMFQEDGHFNIYNVGPVTGGLSADVGELGFDLSGDVFQYYRPYKDEAGYSLTRFYTIGLNEDGHLQVAMSASLTPLFSLSNGKIGTGGLFSMLFDDEEGEFNFLNEYYIWAANSNVSQQAHSPSLADPFVYLTKYVFPKLLVKKTDTATHYTLGSYDSLAAYAPFTSGNILSDEFDSKFSITLADFDVAGDKLSNFYTEEDYQGVLDWFDKFINAGVFEVVDASMEEGEHGPEASMLVKDTFGFTSEFSVSFLTYGEGENVETYLEFGYELVDYKLVATAPLVADAFLEEIDPSYDVSKLQISSHQVTGEYTAQGYIAYAESEDYTVADALQDVVDAFKETGIAKEYELTFEAAAEDDIYVTAYYKDDTTEVTLEVEVFPYEIQGKPAIVTYVTAKDRNAVGTYLYGEDVELLSDYYNAINYWLNDYYGPYISNYVKTAKAAMDAELGMARFGNLAGFDSLIVSGFEALNGINGITISGVGLLDYLFGCEVNVTTGEITWTGTYSSTIFQYAAQYIENEEYYTPEDIDALTEAYGLGVKGAYLGKTDHRYYAYIIVACQQLDQLMDSIVPWADQAAAYLAEKWTYQQSDYSDENWALIQGLYDAIATLWDRTNFKETVDDAVALADAVPTKAEEELAAYKVDKLAALQTAFAGYQEADYYGEGWTALNTACEQGQNAINAATDKDGVDVAYNDCVAAMDAVPTKAEVDAERTAKLSELDAAYNGYNQADYSEDNWAILVKAYNDGKAAINDAKTVEAIDSACEEAKAAMADVLPEAYKTTKIAELQAAYDAKRAPGKEYSDEDKAAMDKILADAKDAVNNGSSKAAVDTLVAKAISDINAFIEVK